MKIVGICGTAESGKSTLANFLVGEKMIEKGMIDEYSIDERGELWCQTDVIDGKKIKKQKIKFDHRNIYRNTEFEVWANKELYPFVKVFSLAKPLKDCACDVFGLSTDQVYFYKNQLTDITYGNMISCVPKNNRPAWDKVATDLLTVREVLEALGSGIFRTIKLKCFVDSCLTKIARTETELAIIDDVRTPFEIESIQASGGKVIRLTRGKEPNFSETGIYEAKVDFDLDNKNLSIPEMFDAATEIMKRV